MKSVTSIKDYKILGSFFRGEDLILTVNRKNCKDSLQILKSSQFLYILFPGFDIYMFLIQYHH